MIRRAWSVYRAELTKLVHRPLGWLPLVVGVVAALLAIWVQRLGQAAVRLEAGEAAVSQLNGFGVWAAAISWGSIAGLVMLVIVAGLVFAEELELGTAKILFSKPLRRVDVVLGKAAVLLTSVVALLACVCIVGGVLSWLLYGFADIAEPDFPDLIHHTWGSEACPTDGTAFCMLQQTFRCVALLVPPMFAVLLVVMCISSLTRQSGISVGVAFAVLLGVRVVGWLVDGCTPFLVTSYIDFPLETLSDYTVGGSSRFWLERWPNGFGKLPLALAVSGLTGFGAWLVTVGIVWWRAVLTLGLVLLPTLGAQAGRAPLRLSEHRVEGQVWRVDVAELDGDGRKDLLVFTTRGGFGPNPRRFLDIFYQKATGGFALTPDHSLEVPYTAVGYDAANLLDGAAGLELLFLEPSGVSALTASDRAFGRERHSVARLPTFFDMAAGNQLPLLSGLVGDVNRDGRADVLVPTKGEAILFVSAKGERWQEGARFQLEYSQNFDVQVKAAFLGRYLSVDARSPQPRLIDVNGDRRLDVATYKDRTIEVFLQGADGQFKADPSYSLLLQIVNEAGEEDELNNVHAQLVDTDGDRMAEVVVHRNIGQVGVFASMRSQVLLYRGRSQGWLAKRPAQSINLKGVSMSPVLTDVDGDGAKDLVLSSVRTDLITNAKRALFSEVVVSYYLYRWDKGAKRFDLAPSFSRDLVIDVERIEGTGTVPLAYFTGDYDGDGVGDLLSLENENELALFFGKATSSFWSGDEFTYADDTKQLLRLETSNYLVVEDLNGDKRDDMVFYYWAPNWKEEERGKLSVVLSR